MGPKEPNEVQQVQVPGAASEAVPDMRLGEEFIESSPVEKDFRVLLMDLKVDMCQRCGLAAQRAT